MPHSATHLPEDIDERSFSETAEEILHEVQECLQQILRLTEEKLKHEDTLAWQEVSELLIEREKKFQKIKMLEAKRKALTTDSGNHRKIQNNIHEIIGLLTAANARLYERLRLGKMQLAKDLTDFADYRSRGTATMTLTMDEEREHLIDIQQK